MKIPYKTEVTEKEKRQEKKEWLQLVVTIVLILIIGYAFKMAAAVIVHLF